MRLPSRLRSRSGEPSPVAVARGGEPAAVPPPIVVRRWVQIVLLPLIILAIWALARAAGTTFLVLVIACLVALVLTPPVRLLSRRMPHGLAILLTYLGVLVLILAIGALLVSPVASQVTHFQSNLPSLTRSANRDLTNVQSFLDRHGIKVHLTKQGGGALATLQKTLAKRSGDIVSFSRGLLSTAVSVGIDLVLIIVLSIYLVVYGGSIGTVVRRIMPSGSGTPDDDYPRLIQHAVSGYVRAQLLFSLTMAIAAALVDVIFGVVGLFPGGERYAIFLGAFYGLMEFIPYIGPIIGPIPALLVCLFEHPIGVVWLLIAFLLLQQAEGHIVAPQLFRISLRINPILVILSLLVGDRLYGIPGALVALPVMAVLRETALYLRRHTRLEGWGPVAPPAPTAGAAAVATTAAEPPGSPPPGLGVLGLNGPDADG